MEAKVSNTQNTPHDTHPDSENTPTQFSLAAASQVNKQPFFRNHGLQYCAKVSDRSGKMLRNSALILCH